MEENVLIGMTLSDFSSLLCIFKVFFNEYNSKTNKNDSILPKSFPSPGPNSYREGYSMEKLPPRFPRSRLITGGSGPHSQEQLQSREL